MTPSVCKTKVRFLPSVTRACVSSRPYPSRTGRPSLTVEGRCGRDQLHFDKSPTPRRAAHRTPGEASAQLGDRQLQLSRCRDAEYPGTGRPTAAPRSECHPRPQVRRGDVTISPRAASPPTYWLAVQVIAHNLASWRPRASLGEQLVTILQEADAAGRLDPLGAPPHCTAVPRAGPGSTFSRALARFRALPLPS